MAKIKWSGAFYVYLAAYILCSLALTKAESPNLRKILYPTYAREPYEMEKWSFYNDMNGGSFGGWSPLSSYSNLINRDSRSNDYVVTAKAIRSTPKVIQEAPKETHKSSVMFMPFYSGRG